jgi:outer membrane PBP1 activator LpoA protein
MVSLFKRAQSETFWSMVEIEYTPENGGRQIIKFELQYKRLSDDQWQELRDRIRSEQLDDKAVVREMVTDWRVKDDDGNPAEFTPENLTQLLNLGFASAIVINLFQNFPKAKQKN